jgi:hypothetical protein
MALPTLDLSQLQIYPLVEQGNSKTAPIWLGKSDWDHRHLEWQLPYLHVTWDPSTLNPDSQRLTLCLTPSDQVAEFYKQLDLGFVRAVTQVSADLFGKSLSADEVGLRYSSALSRTNRLQHIRAKVKRWSPANSAWSTRFWDEATGELLPESYWPDQWIGTEAKAKVVASSIWLAHDKWGLTLSATDVMVRPINRGLPLRRNPFVQEEEKEE